MNELNELWHLRGTPEYKEWLNETCAGYGFTTDKEKQAYAKGIDDAFIATARVPSGKWGCRFDLHDSAIYLVGAKEEHGYLKKMVLDWLASNENHIFEAIGQGCFGTVLAELGEEMEK